MIIGSFAYDKTNDVYAGGIIGLNFSVDRVILKPITAASAKEPNYRITAQTSHGDVELGAGWRRTSGNGSDFVSVSLDGPLLTRPFNAALFLDSDGKSASLVWSRVRAKRNSAATAPEANLSEAVA